MLKWRNLRTSWVYRILRIHSESAHFIGVCWCQEPKRVAFSGIIPKQRSVDNGVLLFSDKQDFYRFISALDCGDHGCHYSEPHKHGFACDVTCTTCKNLTKRRN